MMPDGEKTYSVTLTFLDSAPWWDKITPEEWEAMSPVERLMTKMAISRCAVFNPGDPHCLQAKSPGGTILRSGDSFTATMTVSMT